MGWYDIRWTRLVEDHRALSSPMSDVICSPLTGWNIDNLMIGFIDVSIWQAS